MRVNCIYNPTMVNHAFDLDHHDQEALDHGEEPYIYITIYNGRNSINPMILPSCCFIC